MVKPHTSRSGFAALDPEQARRFLNAARDAPLEALWVLAVTTGLRQGELLALQWSEVDLEGSSVRVTGTLTRINVEVASAGHPKTHRVTAPRSQPGRDAVSRSYGLSWQVTPKVLEELMNDPDTEKADRVTKAMLRMEKIDIAGLQAAHDQA